MDMLLQKDFLMTEKNYLECQSYWRKTFGVLSESMGQTWERWMPQEVVEILRIRDGGAIFDAKCWELDRGFTILQHSFGDFDGMMPSLSGWLKYYDNIEGVPRSEIDPRFPGHNLVLSVILTEGAVEVVKIAIRKWFDADTSISDMELFLKEEIVGVGILDSEAIAPFKCLAADMRG